MRASLRSARGQPPSTLGTRTVSNPRSSTHRRWAAAESRTDLQQMRLGDARRSAAA